jgi:hypothetical protein
MPFDKADAPGRDPDAPMFDPNEHIGDLLVIQVTDILENVETEYGPADVIEADVHVIGRDATISATFERTWLFGKVLFNQLKKKKGRSVLGVLEQGEKRPGRKPPWRLGDPTDAQEAAAIKAMAARPDAAVDQTPEHQRPAAEDPWAAQPTPPNLVPAGKAPWE